MSVSAWAYYDPLTILSYIAAVTADWLGTSVLVLPYHHPCLAKAAATLDVLSVAGSCWVWGWGYRGGAERHGSPTQASVRTDEAITIMQALWTQARPKYGHVYRFSGMACPQTDTNPIPLLIGGVSRPLFAEPRG